MEKGYKKTTVADIVEQAEVSNSSFQHFFRAKDGVLTELVQFMYGNQFKIVRSTAGAKLPPVYIYAVETSLQLALTELNENLREIYLEAYSHEEALDYIQRKTAKELYQIFGAYQPELTEHDFYVLDFGSAGMMRGFMAQPCNESFSFGEKIQGFLRLALCGFLVPEDEVQQVIAFICGLDLLVMARQVMENLFKMLAMHYDFSLVGLLPEN